MSTCRLCGKLAGFYGGMAHNFDLCQGHPTVKAWVGLTDEEIAEGARQSWVDKQAFESAVWWAEEKLREKNGF